MAYRGFSALRILIATLCLHSVANAVYYLAEPDKWRCFKDTVVNNYVSMVLRTRLCHSVTLVCLDS